MGKEGCLLPAYPGPNLQNDIFPVVGVLGQQENLQLALQPLHILTGLVVLLLGQFLHLRVAEQLLGLVPGLLHTLIGAEGLHQGLQLRLFLVQLCHQLRIIIGLRHRQSSLDLAVFGLNGGQLVQHTIPPATYSAVEHKGLHQRQRLPNVHLQPGGQVAGGCGQCRDLSEARTLGQHPGTGQVEAIGHH